MNRRRFLQSTATLFCAPAIVTEVMKLYVPNKDIILPGEFGRIDNFTFIETDWNSITYTITNLSPDDVVHIDSSKYRVL